MDFNISKKNKMRARRNRIKNESKWIIFRIIKLILLAGSLLSFVIEIFFVSNKEYDKLAKFGMIFSISFVLAIITKALIINLSSHWIQDRLNERLWVNSNTLYHFQQVAFASGLNSRHADSTGYTFEFNIDSIRNIKYDDKSKRVEFISDGNGYHYSDVNKQIVDREWPLNGFEAVFYDYFEPSLIRTLENMGKDVERTTINNYSIIDNSI